MLVIELYFLLISMFIKLMILLAYVSYVHPHVEEHIARNISDHRTQFFVGTLILFSLGYWFVSF
jgi:hypothetical protein